MGDRAKALREALEMEDTAVARPMPAGWAKPDPSLDHPDAHGATAALPSEGMGGLDTSNPTLSNRKR